MLYKVLRTGYFSEEKFNKLGAIIGLDEPAAAVAVEKGYLEISREPIKTKTPVETKAPIRTLEASPEEVIQPDIETPSISEAEAPKPETQPAPQPEPVKKRQGRPRLTKNPL